MHLFYTPALQHDIIELAADESLHCARVLRLKPGDEVGLTDGRGTLCRAILTDVSAKSTSASVIFRETAAPKPYRLHMAVAPTKSIDRFEWFIEKAVECGIDEITPVFCARSERTSVKPERLKKLVLAAMKQAQRVYLPTINDGIKFKDFLTRYNTFDLSLIAHCGEVSIPSLKEIYKPHSSTLVLIGPEGDFSEKEVAMAHEKGFAAISLGRYRLRTETAALVACMQINFMNGELG